MAFKIISEMCPAISSGFYYSQSENLNIVGFIGNIEISFYVGLKEWNCHLK